MKNISTESEYLKKCLDLGIDIDTAKSILEYHQGDKNEAYNEALDLATFSEDQSTYIDLDDFIDPDLYERDDDDEYDLR